MIIALFMLPISEKYNDMSTIAAGEVESGHMRKGDTLILVTEQSDS